jgi:hypothetical protein
VRYYEYGQMEYGGLPVELRSLNACRAACVPSGPINGICFSTSPVTAATNGVHPWLASEVQRGSAEMLSTPGYPVSWSVYRVRTAIVLALSPVGDGRVLNGPDAALSGISASVKRIPSG